MSDKTSTAAVQGTPARAKAAAAEQALNPPSARPTERRPAAPARDVTPSNSTSNDDVNVDHVADKADEINNLLAKLKEGDVDTMAFEKVVRTPAITATFEKLAKAIETQRKFSPAAAVGEILKDKWRGFLNSSAGAVTLANAFSLALGEEEYKKLQAKLQADYLDKKLYTNNNRLGEYDLLDTAALEDALQKASGADGKAESLSPLGVTWAAVGKSEAALKIHFGKCGNLKKVYVLPFNIDADMPKVDTVNAALQKSEVGQHAKKDTGKLCACNLCLDRDARSTLKRAEAAVSRRKGAAGVVADLSQRMEAAAADDDDANNDAQLAAAAGGSTASSSGQQQQCLPVAGTSGSQPAQPAAPSSSSSTTMSSAAASSSQTPKQVTSPAAAMPVRPTQQPTSIQQQQGSLNPAMLVVAVLFLLAAIAFIALPKSS